MLRRRREQPGHVPALDETQPIPVETSYIQENADLVEILELGEETADRLEAEEAAKQHAPKSPKMEAPLEVRAEDKRRRNMVLAGTALALVVVAGTAHKSGIVELREVPGTVAEFVETVVSDSFAEHVE